MAKAYSRIGTNLPIPPSSNDKSEIKYYVDKMEELGKLQRQIARCLNYRIYFEWKDNKRNSFEVSCIRFNMFNSNLSGKRYIYQKNSNSVMETELNPPSNIEDEFLEVYNFIKAENVFVGSTDGETDDVILACTELNRRGYEYELTSIVFHNGKATINQGVISNRDGCVFNSKNNVSLDNVLDTINDTSKELRDILDKYNIY